MALGAIFVYPTDIPSSLQHKIRGMLFTAVLVSTLTGVVQLLMPYSVVFYPLMLLLLFFISMLSVYGQRASMVSFTGLIAISLAFANVSTGCSSFYTRRICISWRTILFYWSLLLFIISDPTAMLRLKWLLVLSLLQSI